MFKTVAPRYDFLNTFLSLGIDAQWRRKLADKIFTQKPTRIADIACGSGAVVWSILHKFEKNRATLPHVSGFDFCEELLELARTHKNAQQWHSHTNFSTADALMLPCPDASFQALTVSFGLRNFQSRNEFYKESLRVLEPQGALYILEFSQPHPLLKPFYRLYQLLIPFVAALFGGNASAYSYLNSSINAFPDAPALSNELIAAGFKTVEYQKLTGGIVALHKATKA